MPRRNIRASETVPLEYVGREQSLLKHWVLEEYLRSWAQKLGSAARTREVHLFYVDCFAGPWEAQSERLEDTSIAIGLNALEEAAGRWSKQGIIRTSAIFVEKKPESFANLKRYLEARRGRVATHPFPGSFAEHVARIDQMIGSSAAFLFIDPTGFKDVAMDFIAPLAKRRFRDVMINVMFNDVNRFKDDERGFLREQMKGLFGLKSGDLPQDLDESALFTLYRAQLKKTCGVDYAADLAIPHPKMERTWFRLVVGGHNKAVLELFRDVEKRVCGTVAGQVRAAAKQRDKDQLSFTLPGNDDRFDRFRNEGLAAARRRLTERKPGSVTPFMLLWTEYLQELHITRSDVARILRDLIVEGRARVRGKDDAQKAVQDHHLIEFL